MNNKWNELNKAQRWEVSEIIAEMNLPTINKSIREVEYKDTFYTKYIKRFFDIFFSLIALIILSPVLIIMAILTYLDVGHPIIFKQTRVGKNGKPFTMYKFRNMTNEVDANGELLHPSKRVTKLGKFMRRTSLDELLNFYSVLKGDMSLISPRPLVEEYTNRYNKRHKGRLLIKPGLECPPIDPSKSNRTWQNQFDNDVWYVENISFKTDLKMTLNFIKLLFDRSNNKQRSNATGKGSFIGYNEEGKVINEKGVPLELIERVLNK